jgi:uncharacterized protein (UPF0332 family)
MNDPGKTELVNYRLTKAKETLKEVDLHIQNELWGTAVNRLYYACFYVVTALLLQFDIYAKTHNGTRQMFGLHFIKPGIVSQRSGDYYKNILYPLKKSG